MKKVSIFYGKEETVKMDRAMSIAKEKGRRWICDDVYEYKESIRHCSFSNIPIDTIILHSIPECFNWELLFDIISSDVMLIFQEKRDPVAMKTPEFILITSKKPKLSSRFYGLVDIIKFKKVHSISKIN